LGIDATEQDFVEPFERGEWQTLISSVLHKFATGQLRDTSRA
jgi:hypothetical protein